MHNPGKRVKLVKWIHGRQRVVRVMVDAVIPDADPSEPCLDLEKVRWLDELQQLADRGGGADTEAPARAGDVYVRRSA